MPSVNGHTIKYIFHLSMYSNADIKLHACEKKYSRLVANLSELYFFFSRNPNGKFTYVSNTVEKILGYTSKEFLTSQSLIFHHKYNNREEGSFLSFPFTGDSETPYEIVASHKDGSIKHLELRESPVYDNEHILIGTEGICHDITNNKNNEPAIRKTLEEKEALLLALRIKNDIFSQTLNELRETQKQLVESEKLAALGGLVAGIAHEINTPLGVAITAATALETRIIRLTDRIDNITPHNPEISGSIQSFSEGIKIIVHNLKQAAGLVNGFKQVAIDQSSERKRKFNIKEYTEDIILNLNPGLKKKEIKINTDFPDDIIIDSYPGAFSQIITNLVINSATHGFENNNSGRINIKCRIMNGMLSLFYSDNGKGMTAETAEKIYDPFFTTNRSTGGSGLGMHIIYNLITQVFKGSIQCESTPGEGVLFKIQFPVDICRNNIKVNGKACSS